MKNILVSGASGVVGYGILKSLRELDDVFLVGTSIYPDSVAPAFCDVFEQVLPTNDPGYINQLIGILLKHDIDMMIPGIDDDMYKWNENRNILQYSDAYPLLNKKDLIELCNDKWEFYKKISDKPYAIDSALGSYFEYFSRNYGLPFIQKPRHGFGSKGVKKVDSIYGFDSELISQPIVGTDDEEYTTSVFADGEGSYWTSMTLKRKLSKDGYTEKAEVVHLDEIQEAIKDLCKIFKPLGPTNFQFRKQEKQVKLLEINPRISSSTSIRSAFGYNESEMAVEYFLEGKIPVQPEIRQGKAVRYIEDKIFYV